MVTPPAVSAALLVTLGGRWPSGHEKTKSVEAPRDHRRGWLPRHVRIHVPSERPRCGRQLSLSHTTRANESRGSSEASQRLVRRSAVLSRRRTGRFVAGSGRGTSGKPRGLRLPLHPRRARKRVQILTAGTAAKIHTCLGTVLQESKQSISSNFSRYFRFVDP